MIGDVWHIYDDPFLIGRKDIENSDPDAFERSKGGYMKDDKGNQLFNPTIYWTNYAGDNVSAKPTAVFLNNDGDKEAYGCSQMMINLSFVLSQMAR